MRAGSLAESAEPAPTHLMLFRKSRAEEREYISIHIKCRHRRDILNHLEYKEDDGIASEEMANLQNRPF